MRMTYAMFVAMNALKHNLEPGDTITLALRNEESATGMFAQVQRLNDMFLECHNFLPEEIALHPEQLALIKSMGKSLDVLIKNEKMGEIIGEVLDLATMPTVVPLVEDDTLDLFTAVARFHYSKEHEQDFRMQALQYVIDKFKGK